MNGKDPETVSRRRLFGLAGAGVALAGAGAAAGFGAARASDGPADGVVAFRDTHQAGIVTPAQDRLHFVALDLSTADRSAVQDLFRRWTDAAERMTSGGEVTVNGAVGLNPQSPPTDTGEALGLAPSSLTLTFGIGASLLAKLGLTDRRPPALIDLPRFTADQLEPARSGGDLCIQACADDPQVAVHAIRNLVRMGFGTTEVRWSQLGFGRTSSTSTEQATARNLFGFKDGTNNLKAEDPAQLDEHVWAQAADGCDWMAGGTYLVARRIRMHIEVWDRTSLDEQEKVIGRSKGEGAPLTGQAEFDTADLAAQGPDGEPVIPEDSHIRLASAESLRGVRMLRRGYNFVDGSDGAGHLDAGLFFVAFVRDPGRQFVPMQRALSRKDTLMEYIEHSGSAVFACPPGLSAPGSYWGQALFV
ncbi:iron uptake transporter deferrochelatase/peroxidase subunit [Pseudonocardia sp. KRD291]|uniref:iron uptake transporter deferrochelatase/peroxidase subunit n=1 Tax=Pseudonocardia sp. KRD291 TaxID=2792007 RepID=UPI001C49CE84|nr:iron uptake transporter deferrochelatase/peroxidase subunit [Pseudonocardia sp. KRD291]MBW0102158.1 deferrochelatase/peroxidase EfeB [Pseudonocardia sp. KRD291]